MNDVLFSMHAVLLTLITVFQCFVYEVISSSRFHRCKKSKILIKFLFLKKGNQRVSKIAIGILTILIGFLTVSFFVTFTGKLDGLNFAYYFSYVKLAITLMKYFPQVSKKFIS